MAREDILQFWLWLIRTNNLDRPSSSSDTSDRKQFIGMYQKKRYTPPARRPGGSSCTWTAMNVIFTYIPCSILILSKFFLFNNRRTIELS
jgi:hypothetical protein